MKIAIHHREGSYSSYWIEYCKKHQVDYKLVNAYASDIIEQVSDCDIFMWHFHQCDPRDMNFAKQLLFSLQQAGKIVYPDFNSAWHFDDKLGQKYLFEAFDIKSAPAYAFYDKKEALAWAKQTTYPKVFKLRGGAGSYNVELAHNYNEARRFIRKSFGKGWKSYDKWHHFCRIFIEFCNGQVSLRQLLGHTLANFKIVREDFLPSHRAYAYFQEFIPNNGFDYRVEVCGKKCIAMVRYCRKNDFRASGGHHDCFEHDKIPADVIQFAFEVSNKMNLQSAAVDIVRHKDTNELFIVENSYCYGVDADEFMHGYWTDDCVWHDEPFNGIDWTIEYMIEQYKQNTK